MINNNLDGKLSLTDLIEEIENWDPEMFPPPYEKQDDDGSELCVVTDPFLRKLFSLSNFYRREAKRLQVDLEAEGKGVQGHSEFQRLKSRHELLTEMFWFLLRTTADNHFQHSMGIRKGWKVYIDKDEEQGKYKRNVDPEDIPRFLRKIIEDLN